MLKSLAARRRFKKMVTYMSVLFYGLFVMFPMYWILLTSLRTQKVIYTQKDMLIPRLLTIQNYVDLFAKWPMARWLGNSTIVVTVTTVCSLVIAVLAAYSLARLRYRGAQTIAKTVLFMYLLPQVLLYIPLFLLLNTLDVLNSRLSLFLTYPTFILPFCTWILIGYFRTIPEELEDAARIDGCNRLQVLYLVVMPLAKPAIVTAAIFSLASAWNEFLYALVFLNSEYLKTVQIGVASLRFSDMIFWGVMMAGAVIATLPPVLLYMFLQKFVVEGLTAGAVKG